MPSTEAKGSELCKRSAEATQCTPWWNRKDNFCLCVCVCAPTHEKGTVRHPKCVCQWPGRVSVVSGAHIEGCTSLMALLGCRHTPGWSAGGWSLWYSGVRVSHRRAKILLRLLCHPPGWLRSPNSPLGLVCRPRPVQGH